MLLTHFSIRLCTYFITFNTVEGLDQQLLTAKERQQRGAWWPGSSSITQVPYYGKDPALLPIGLGGQDPALSLRLHVVARIQLYHPGTIIWPGSTSITYWTKWPGSTSLSNWARRPGSSSITQVPCYGQDPPLSP